MTVLSGARHPSAGACGMRRLPVLLLAVMLAAGACRGARDDDGAASSAPEAGDAAAVGEDSAAAPAAPGAPLTREDSIRLVRDDSVQEARLMRTRQAAMDSYAGCVAKAKGADPEQRTVLETACLRAHGAPAAASPR